MLSWCRFWLFQVKSTLQPSNVTKYQSVVNDLRETTYKSYWNKQLGKSRDATGYLPVQTDIETTTFGNPTRRGILLIINSSNKFYFHPLKVHYFSSFVIIKLLLLLFCRLHHERFNKSFKDTLWSFLGKSTRTRVLQEVSQQLQSRRENKQRVKTKSFQTLVEWFLHFGINPRTMLQVLSKFQRQTQIRYTNNVRPSRVMGQMRLYLAHTEPTNNSQQCSRKNGRKDKTCLGKNVYSNRK